MSVGLSQPAVVMLTHTYSHKQRPHRETQPMTVRKGGTRAVRETQKEESWGLKKEPLRGQPGRGAVGSRKRDHLEDLSPGDGDVRSSQGPGLRAVDRGSPWDSPGGREEQI